MTPFLRHLTHITRIHDLCTIVVNSTTPIRCTDIATVPAAQSINPLPSSSPYDPAYFKPKFDGPSSNSNTDTESVSIFKANGWKPALGKTFPGFADLHLLLSSLPKGKKDVDAMQRQKDRIGNTSRAELVTVAEILTDRWDERVGRWAPFKIGADGSLQDIL